MDTFLRYGGPRVKVEDFHRRENFHASDVLKGRDECVDLAYYVIFVALSGSYPHCIVDAILRKEVVRVEPSPVRLPHAERSVSRCGDRCGCRRVGCSTVSKNRHFNSSTKP